MSKQVALDELAATLAGFGFGYVLTRRDDGRPNISAVHPAVRGGAVHVPGAGHRTRANIAVRPDVTVLWPPKEEGGYSLIVDGVATVDGDDISIAPCRAVLHRPAPPRPPEPGGACVSDCVEIPLV